MSGSTRGTAADSAAGASAADGGGGGVLLVDCVRAVLARNAASHWMVHQGERWCSVDPPTRERRRVQGWKLHVSATPLSAPLVLAEAAAVLVRRHHPFKFAATLREVAELCSAHADRGSGGKFLTVYPEGGDDELRALAEELHRVTDGLPGPGVLSDRPYRPSSLVHYRYGAFAGVPMLGNDGSYEALLLAPDGSLVRDERKAWFAPPSWAPADPFTASRSTGPPTGPQSATPAAVKPVLLNDRYVVRQAIRHSFKGGVFRATDTRDGGEVVIKQARRHVGATTTGQDVRNNLRHEAEMLVLLGPTGTTPRSVETFAQQGDLFLVQEAISGSTLRTWVQEHTEFDADGRWGPPVAEVVRIARLLTELVASVHRSGVVIQDLSPNNIMITQEGGLRLVDVEFVARAGEQTVRAYTPGYGAPEQVASLPVGPAPAPVVDLFGLGATLFHLVSGVDPLLAADLPQQRTVRARLQDWLDRVAVDNDTARRLAPIIGALVHDDPDRRPAVAAVRSFLAPATGAAEVRPRQARSRGQVDPDHLGRMVADGVEQLITSMNPGSPDRLWHTGPFGSTTDPCNVQHGAAGVLGVLDRAHQLEPDPELGDVLVTAAHWIVRQLAREPRALPGLHFGRSGTAWALLEVGTRLGDPELVSQAEDLAKRVPVRWPNPDVCHGVAGAGLAQVRFWEATGDQEFLDRARRAADAIVAAADYRQGHLRWPIPTDFASVLAGLVHYGFAHGVAGIGAFLLAAGRSTGEGSYLELASAAADTLAAVVTLDRGGAYWASGEPGDIPRTTWCSGSSGVGTFLVRMWQENGADRLLELAHQAGVAVHRSRWHVGTAQCHGLAGDGEFLLDLGAATGEQRYRDWAGDLATCIHARHALRDGRMVAPDESHTGVSFDFGGGLSGVLAFLMRLRSGGRRLWLPEALTGP